MASVVGPTEIFNFNCHQQVKQQQNSKSKTKPRAPFSAKYFRRREEKKNNNENCVRLLLCCRLFLWCHRIIILLDGYQHSTVTTHTHTHTNGERAWHAPFTGRRGQGQPAETHTHTLHQWKRHATTVRSVTTFWQFLFKLFFVFFAVRNYKKKPCSTFTKKIKHLIESNRQKSFRCESTRSLV